MQNWEKYEYFADEVGDVLEDIKQFGIAEDTWHVIAPKSEKEQMEQENEGPVLDDSPFNAFESSVQQRAAANDTRSTSFQYEMLTENMPTSEWIECPFIEWETIQPSSVHCWLGN